MSEWENTSYFIEQITLIPLRLIDWLIDWLTFPLQFSQTPNISIVSSTIYSDIDGIVLSATRAFGWMWMNNYTKTDQSLSLPSALLASTAWNVREIRMCFRMYEQLWLMTNVRPTPNCKPTKSDHAGTYVRSCIQVRFRQNSQPTPPILISLTLQTLTRIAR